MRARYTDRALNGAYINRNNDARKLVTVELCRIEELL